MFLNVWKTKIKREGEKGRKRKIKEKGSGGVEGER